MRYGYANQITVCSNCQGDGHVHKQENGSWSYIHTKFTHGMPSVEGDTKPCPVCNGRGQKRM